MVKYFKDQMQGVVGDGVDLLFCNEEEAMLFTDTETIMEAREALKKFAKRFAITQGSNGAMIFDGDTFIDIEPYKVEAIDTNGAGDLFAGAFMYGITNNRSFAAAGKLASLASSKVVTKYGPRLDFGTGAASTKGFGIICKKDYQKMIIRKIHKLLLPL